MSDSPVARLARLRSDVINVVGFYDLLDKNMNMTPYKTMIYQIHLNASAMKIALEVHSILEDFPETGHDAD